MQVTGRMAVGSRRVSWWGTLSSLICLLPGTFGGDVGKEKGETGSSGSDTPSVVPGLSVVYSITKHHYPGHAAIACIMEDMDDVLLTHLVPPHLPNPTFRDRGWMQEVKWHVLVKGETARGAVCHTAAAPLYPVSFPLMSWKARLLPEYLSYTISAGEGLRVRLRGAKPRGEVWWQKEPIQAQEWKQSTFDDNGTLIIPATMLSGSGFYSFVNESNVNDTDILGTFSLLIRDCPAHRYGDDCRSWCSDCLHGGVCHPRTGACVCLDGIMGRRCEGRCARGMSGRNCSLLALNVPERQICQPAPAPCRCVPGYTGPRCNIACAVGKWGADCAQDCSHRCIGNCDSETGECDAQGPSPCAGGDVGLPRLRRAPKVTDIGAEQATVEFSKWREGYDDGDAALWSTLTYIIRLRMKTDNSKDGFIKDIISSGPRHTLTNLTPVTKYEVMVMVMVSKAGRNLTCMADGKGRERVHSVFFTTSCPEEIPAPVIVRAEKTSDTSVFVKWKPVPRPRGCHVQYHLSATPAVSRGASVSLDIRNITLTKTYTEVGGLQANVAYNISVLAKSVSRPSSISASSSTILKIHKKSVGHARTAAVVAAVLVVTAVVIIVLLWRRRRRQPRSTMSAVSIPATEGGPPSPPSSCGRTDEGSRA